MRLTILDNQQQDQAINDNKTEMKSDEFKLRVPDGIDLHVYEWLPDDPDKITGLVQIAHGMADHSARYGDFARFLTMNDFEKLVSFSIKNC
jgi:alpha-beta hydrolase superfamily lysophospholipase